MATAARIEPLDLDVGRPEIWRENRWEPLMDRLRAEAPVDCSKARRELRWEPRPVEESIREAARFWVGLKKTRKQASS